jgi:hypothetical protein
MAPKAAPKAKKTPTKKAAKKATGAKKEKKEKVRGWLRACPCAPATIRCTGRRGGSSANPCAPCRPAGALPHCCARMPPPLLPCLQDPNAPKRPLSAYFCFTAVRAGLKSQRRGGMAG